MVLVYTTPDCPYCRMVKQFLKQRNIPFKELDVTKNKAWAQELIRKSGQNGVPVTDFNGTIIIGFDRAKLERLSKR